VAACRSILQAGTSRGHRLTVHQSCANSHAASRRGDAAVAIRCYSNYHPPSTFPSLNRKGWCHRRSFSKFSQDEFVIQDPGPPPAAPKNAAAAATSTTAAKPSSTLSENDTPQSSQPQKILTGDNIEQVARKTANNKLLIELHGAHELFHQIYTEAQALLRNNKSSTTSEEIVAMSDYFMILVNSLDLEKSLEMIQSLQTALREKQEGKQRENKLYAEEREVEEKLRQAVKSMSQLHHVFLTMVESSLPLNPPILPKETDGQSKKDGGIDVPSFDKDLYSAMTVGRALQLSRRAAELGMPLHRPLYQRLATGVVLTSSPVVASIPEPSPPADDAAESELTEPTSTETEPTSLILPGKVQQIKEGLQTPPLTLKLLGIFQQARGVLNISSGEQLHQLAMELFTVPFLLMLKQKQWDEAMGLVGGWRALSGKGEKIDLLSLLGENNTFDALEIAKGWLGDTKFGEDNQSNPHVMELTNLLEVAVSEILKGQKQRAEKLSHLLWQLSLRNDDGDFDGESDSDSDFEDDFDYGSDGEEELVTPAPTPTPMTDFTPSDLPVVLGKREVEWHDKNTLTLSSNADDATTPKLENDQGKDAEESTIITGLMDNEARQSIYLRNGVDWVLPDIVPTLEEWNKGNQLTFTPEFERYLGRQIMKEEIEDDEP